MNWLDIVVLVVIVVPTFIGLKKGIIKTVFTVAGVIIGVILAGNFYEAIAGMLTFISSPGIAKVVAFALILVVVMVIATVLAAVIKTIASAMLLGWVNRLGGALLGFILGFVFCGAVITMWAKFIGSGATISESILAGLLLDGFPIVLALLPEEFDSVRSFFQ